MFNYFCVAETKGLSEKEKKSLYIPGAKFGRKLKQAEHGNRYMRVSIKERRLSVSSILDNEERKSKLKSRTSRMVSSLIEIPKAYSDVLVGDEKNSNRSETITGN